jgi:alpha-beta hydrolase superfamily lysophospholipase
MQTIYYLPGARGELHTGLGHGLTDRGFQLAGRATVGEFRQYSFDDQVAVIANDLQQPQWWNPDARVITNSYGGYLFLNAQLTMSPYPGTVLMLSPILSGFDDEQTGRSFVPPYADRLMQRVRAREFPAPERLQIHTGSIDWQSPPDLVTEFATLTGASVTIAPGRGHMLGKDYVGPVLDAWLADH